MGEWRCSSAIITLDTGWKWVVIFTPLPLCPRWKSPSSNKGGWLGLTAGQGPMEWIKISYPDGDRNPTSRFPALSWLLLTDWAIPAYNNNYNTNTYMNMNETQSLNSSYFNHTRSCSTSRPYSLSCWEASFSTSELWTFLSYLSLFKGVVCLFVLSYIFLRQKPKQQ
jgi:hypothetical protein